MNKSLLIVTEAGGKIGLGHIIRCKVVFDEYISTGYNCKLIVNTFPPFQLEGNFLCEDWLLNIDKLINKKGDYKKILIDSYLLPKDKLELISQNFEQVFFIDDYNRLTYQNCYLINPNTSGKRYTYQGATSFINGAEYIILRQEFRHIKQVKKHKNRIKEVLISYGGSDYRNLIPITLAFLKDKNINIKVISPNNNMLENSESSIEFTGQLNAKEISKVMLETDIAFCACGQTLNELSALGIPSIAICIDIDQVPNMEFYYENQLIPEKIYWDDQHLLTLLTAAYNTLEVKDYREKTSNTAQNIIHKNGVENIVQWILSK